MMKNAQPGAGQRQAMHMAEAAETRKPRGVSMFGIDRSLQESPEFTEKMKSVRALNAKLMGAAAEYDRQHPDGY